MIIVYQNTLRSSSILIKIFKVFLIQKVLSDKQKNRKPEPAVKTIRTIF
uniref:Uncharacterized protein n=1 Tax=Siphoviridae sp. ctLAG1 TaxID=2826248 RepID=A0A8S5MG32_9CAUD|nr:MAG TPA: hypothetical protein [Siphoviridae sp. ctLAG1]